MLAVCWDTFVNPVRLQRAIQRRARPQRTSSRIRRYGQVRQHYAV
jgi:hypothetical protein